jgi:alkylation response protein AidB-like acyl-CoA dehydrogenase
VSFAAAPMVPGDLFDSAARFAAAYDTRLARLASLEERAELLEEAWRELTALGWPSVAIPEAAGGAGGGLGDVAALVEGAACSAAALPLASVIGVGPILLAGAGDAGRPLLAGIAAGTHRVAAGIAPIHTSSAGSPMTAQWVGDVPRLSGGMIGIECPPDATHVLVGCTVEGEAVMLLLSSNDERAAFRHHERIDCRPTLDIQFGEARLLKGTILARGRDVGGAIERATQVGAFLTCVEAVAAMGALLGQTIRYLNERVQFDAPLSTFQVLRHKVADLYVVYGNLRAMVMDLLDRIASPSAWPERGLDLAKLHIGAASRRFAAATIQLHGGMGMTEELLASRLAKRLLMVEFEYGGAAFHEARLMARGDRPDAAA